MLQKWGKANNSKNKRNIVIKWFKKAENTRTISMKKSSIKYIYFILKNKTKNGVLINHSIFVITKRTDCNFENTNSELKNIYLHQKAHKVAREY